MAKHAGRPREGAADAGFRGQRLEGIFREELNSLLDGEIADPRLEGTRVTRVELTRDGSRARVWFALPSDVEDVRAVELAFERAAGFLRSRLCEALPLKRVPELAFRYDPAQTGPDAEEWPLEESE